MGPGGHQNQNSCKSVTGAAVRRMLLLVGTKTMLTRLGRGEAGPAEQRFLHVATPLARAVLLAILAEHAAWHVHDAKNTAAADEFLREIVVAVDNRALLVL